MVCMVWSPSSVCDIFIIPCACVTQKIMPRICFENAAKLKIPSDIGLEYSRVPNSALITRSSAN